MTASKPWKARAPSTDVSVWSLRTPEGSSIINRSSVIFVPMIGAAYIWNSFLARFSLERDHLARLFGKSPPNIIGVSDEMFAQFLQLPAELALLRRHHGDRRGNIRLRRFRRRLL